MRVRLDIQGPGVSELVLYFQTAFGWTFETFAQTTFFSGFAIGSHVSPEQFVGIGINDGTYCSKVVVLNEG